MQRGVVSLLLPSLNVVTVGLVPRKKGSRGEMTKGASGRCSCVDEQDAAELAGELGGTIPTSALEVLICFLKNTTKVSSRSEILTLGKGGPQCVTRSWQGLGSLLQP